MIFAMIFPEPLVEGVCYKCTDCGCIPHSQYSSALVKCGFFLGSICCKKILCGGHSYAYMLMEGEFLEYNKFIELDIFQILLEHHYSWLLVFVLSLGISLQTSAINLHNVILSDSQKSLK